MMVAGFDKQTQTPQLYQVDPSGTYFGWKASAIGKNFKAMKTFLEKRITVKEDEMSLEDAIHIAIMTLAENSEGGLTPETVEVGVVDSTGEFRVLPADRVADFIQERE